MPTNILGGISHVRTATGLDLEDYFYVELLKLGTTWLYILPSEWMAWQSMKDRYLSIITNFGCHYTCPYCIVKHNGIKVPITTVEGLDGLKQAIVENGANIVSVSGGGDPMFNLKEHLDWWAKLHTILSELDIPLEIHTSYTDRIACSDICKRIVYHLRDKSQLAKIRRNRPDEIVRVVFVVTDDMTEADIFYIAGFVSMSSEIDELSFRQMVKPNYESSYHLHDFLKDGHQKDWWYIEQCDYNVYYAENRVYTNYRDFMEESE